MTPSQEPTGVLRRVLRRLHRSEAGQGLVEYALIIVVVSLGSLVALNYLGDEVSNLFNKAGSSIREGAGPGGGSGGSGGGNLPTVVTPVTIPGPGAGTGQYLPAGATTGPTGYTGVPGLYTDNPPNGVQTGTPCGGIPVGSGGGTTPSGWVWVDEDDLPNAQQWGLPGAPGTPFEFACIDPAGVNLPPWVTGVTLANGGVAGRVDSGDTITITFSESVSAASICTGWNGTIGGNTGESIGVFHDNSSPEELSFNDGGSGCDPQIGDIVLTPNYLSDNPRSYAATMSLGGATGTTLVITLTNSGSGGNPNTIGSASTAVFDPDGDIDDSTGLGVVNVDFSIPSAIHF